MLRTIRLPTLTILALALCQNTLAQPANDECAHAIPVANHSITAWDSTGSTQSVVLPCDNFPDLAIDVWYSYTTTGPETVTITTCGGATDYTSVGVFLGCDGTLVACDSWSCADHSQSEVTFQAPGAATYLICLVGYGGGAEGPGLMGVNTPIVIPPPPNDTCATAQVLTAPGSYPFDSRSAATDGPSGSCNVGGRPDTHDVFFRYIPASDGWVRFDTLQNAQNLGANATLDTAIQVFDGCGGTVLACNDDVNWTGASPSHLFVGSLTCPVHVRAGAGYVIRVATSGENSSGGLGILRLSSAPGPIVYASPAGAQPEPGPDCDDDYGSDVNYGCNPRTSPATLRATPIHLCDTYKGHVYARTTPLPDGIVVNDFDAYQFTLAVPDTIHVTGQAQFVGVVLLNSLPCGSGTTYSGQLDQYTNSECGAAEFDLSWQLPAGDYFVGFGTAPVALPVCGQNNEYWFHISGSAPCTGACCNGTTCTVSTQAACTSAYQGAGVACGAAGNPTTCCPVNFDGVNGVQVADIFAFLNAWFAGDPRSDFDQLSGIQVADIFAFLNAWFVGC